MPCIDREHRLDWMRQAEQQQQQQPDQGVKEAVAKVFECRVQQLLHGTRSSSNAAGKLPSW